MNKLLLVAPVLLLLLLIFAGLGYYGLIPGVSDVFGPAQQRDLGISYNAETIQAVETKIGIPTEIQMLSFDKDPEGIKPLAFKGKKDITYSLNSTELSALLRDRGWAYYPVSKTQIKINQDGTVEASGMVRVGRLSSWITATGGDGTVINRVNEKIKFPAKDMPGYIKGKLSVVDNKVSLDVQQAEIGRMPIPMRLVSQYREDIQNFIEERMRFVPNLNVKKIEFSNGVMNFEGSVPEIEIIPVATNPKLD